MLHSLDILTDLDVDLVSPDPTLFPRIPTPVEVHHGFATYHKKTANLILAEVRKLMAKHSSSNVVLVRPLPLKDNLVWAPYRLIL